MPRRAWPLLLLLLAAVALGPSRGRAQISPQFHGLLRVEPSRGAMDRTTGSGMVRVRGWTLILNAEVSDGIRPAEEALLVAFGDDRFPLPPGSLRASRNGKRFTYRQKLRNDQRGIKRLSIREQRAGWYRLRFTLVGVDFSRLFFDDPTCVSIAVVVGDDDGFTGVNAGTLRPFSRRVGLTGECEPDDWPWA